MTEARAILEALAALNIMLQKRERVLDAFLQGINAQMPYVGFQPKISNSRHQFLAAGVSTNIRLPSGTQAIKFGYSASPLYVSVLGGVDLPTAAITDTESNTGLIVNPEGWYFTGGGLKEVSALAPADTILSVHCHIQQ